MTIVSKVALTLDQNALVAQLVEQHHGKVWVAGSNPAEGFGQRKHVM